MKHWTMDEAVTLHASRWAKWPARKRAEVARVWERYRELQGLVEAKGVLVPVKLATELLHHSPGQIRSLVLKGELEATHISIYLFVLGNSLERYAACPRVPPEVPCRPWSEGEERLLGSRKDQEVAELLGRPLWQVQERRRELGIHGCYRRWPRRHWTAEEVRLLGSAPDAVIGRKLGCGASAVSKQRRSLGIPSYQQSGGRRQRKAGPVWSEVSRATAPDFPWAAELSGEAKAALARAWKDFESFKGLRTVHGLLLPEVFAAGLLSVTRQQVNYLVKEGRVERVEAGGLRLVSGQSVERYARSKPHRGRAPRVWTAEEDRLLGTVSDQSLGQRLGCSDYAVRLRRLELGIRSYLDSRRRRSSVGG